jgi:hypothetical protein
MRALSDRPQSGSNQTLTGGLLRQQAGRAVPVSVDIGAAVAKEGAKRGINAGKHGSCLVHSNFRSAGVSPVSQRREHFPPFILKEFLS